MTLMFFYTLLKCRNFFPIFQKWQHLFLTIPKNDRIFLKFYKNDRFFFTSSHKNFLTVCKNAWVFNFNLKAHIWCNKYCLFILDMKLNAKIINFKWINLCLAWISIACFDTILFRNITWVYFQQLWT